MGTPTSNATCGGAGQVVTRLSIGTANGYSNYHGAYFSFKASDFHGLTLQENLTISKALGLNAYNQSTSSIAAVDSFNRREQYGCQSFDQRVICKHLHRVSASLLQGTERIVGRLAGGWTISPVLTAGTGQPLQCVTNNNVRTLAMKTAPSLLTAYACSAYGNHAVERLETFIGECKLESFEFRSGSPV
jgi:hypothetical protein